MMSAGLLFLRWLRAVLLLASGLFLAGAALGDVVSSRVSQAERDLNALYGEPVGDWKGRETLKKPKDEAKQKAPAKPSAREESLPVEDFAKAGWPKGEGEAAVKTAPVTPVAPEAAAVLPKGEALDRRMPAAREQASDAANPAARAARAASGYVVYGRDGRVDDVATVESFRKAAMRGDSVAQFNLGLAFEHGWGVRPNLKEALNWYSRAAGKNHAGAQLNLGLLYYAGRGVKQDVAHAVTLFRKAADQGNAIAQFNMSNVCLRGEGVKPDEKAAMDWLQRSAKGGYMVAQYVLAKMYVYGDGVEPDVGEAIGWYSQAALQGMMEAEAAMGLAYERGFGVKQDRQEAMRWYALAAKQGHRVAKERLAIMKVLP